MLSTFRRGNMSLAGKSDGRAHTNQLFGKRLVYRDYTQRRRISVALIDGSEIKGLVMRRCNHDHSRKLAAFQRRVSVGSDGAGELITGVRCDHSENRVV